MLAPGGRTVVLALLLCAATCKRTATGSVSLSPQETLQPVGTLPSGCGIVASLDPVALGPFAESLKTAGASQVLANPVLARIDLTRDLRRVSYCKLSGTGHAKPGFIVLLSGQIPGDFVDRLAQDSKQRLVREVWAGASVAGRDGFWIGRRAQDHQGSAEEVAIASDRESLRAAFTGAAGTYHLDASAPLSIVVDGSQVRAFLPSSRGPRKSGLEAVSELRITLSPGATALIALFVVGDATISQRLASDLQPALTLMVRQLVGANSPPPKVSTSVDATDVVTRVELPPGTLESLASRMATARVNQGSLAAH